MRQTREVHLIRIVLVLGLSIFAAYAVGNFVHESIRAYASKGATQVCYLGWWSRYSYWAWVDGEDESGLDHNETLATFFQILTTISIGVPLAVFLGSGYLACEENDEETPADRQHRDTSPSLKIGTPDPLRA